MSEHREVTTPYGTVSKISWGAVIAGTMIKLVVAMLLEFLGLAIGFLRSISPRNRIR